MALTSQQRLPFAVGVATGIAFLWIWISLGLGIQRTGTTTVQNSSPEVGPVFDNFQRHEVIPPIAELQRMDHRRLEELYYSVVESIQVRCKQQIHLGLLADGGYDVCADPDVAPRMPCLVYSFGIRQDFNFDDQLSQTFGCEIHGFDPSNGMKDHKHAEKVYFHSKGLYDKNGVFYRNWTMRTFNTIRTELGHTERRIDVLKIDIESGEWVALREMIDSGALGGVKQLILELHTYVHIKQTHVDGQSDESYVQHLGVLRDLHRLGFRIFYFRRFHGSACLFKSHHDGRQYTGCSEVHFMNRSTVNGDG